MGTVVAYEFCYKYTLTSGSRDDVVSIVVMESVGGDYRVVWTANEREDRSCSTDTVPGFSIVRCCGRTDLASEEMFSVSILIMHMGLSPQPAHRTYYSTL